VFLIWNLFQAYDMTQNDQIEQKIKEMKEKSQTQKCLKQLIKKKIKLRIEMKVVPKNSQ
jgi:hypothetical protein